MDLRLDVLGIEKFDNPDNLWNRSVPRRSDADYQFDVFLPQYAVQTIGFRVFLIEPDKVAALETYLDELEGRPGPTVTIHQAVVFTAVAPWLGIALLTSADCIVSSEAN